MRFARVAAVLLLGSVIAVSWWTQTRLPEPAHIPLFEARAGRAAGIVKQESESRVAAIPPNELAQHVRYSTTLGQFAAYLSLPKTDGKKYPAIVWIHGGDYTSIGKFWDDEYFLKNVYSQFLKSGVVVMIPSLRGGNDNPGFHEGFYGEVEDVVAAAEYLSKLDYVDPNRVYLGGHSTGGTLALLTAEDSDRFRAVFSLGPVTDPRGYNDRYVPKIGRGDELGFKLRSPWYWLGSIRSPTFVFEGADRPGNIGALKALAKMPRNPLTHFYLVPGKDHYSLLEPLLPSIAHKILADTGPQSEVRFDETELRAL
jgi:acetyl esterase/lipase